MFREMDRIMKLNPNTTSASEMLVLREITLVFVLEDTLLLPAQILVRSHLLVLRLLSTVLMPADFGLCASPLFSVLCLQVTLSPGFVKFLLENHSKFMTGTRPLYLKFIIEYLHSI